MGWMSARTTISSRLYHWHLAATADSGRAGGMTPLGIEGWRFVFLTIALVSVTIGIATLFLSHDPRFDSDTEVSHSAKETETQTCVDCTPMAGS